ncbi:putative ribonuclease H-like domain-containing protein [Tanacetum coccineum]
MVPKVVLMRSGLVSLATARPVNTAQPRSTVNSVRPMTNVFNKAHSTVRRPINNKTATKKSNFNQGVNNVKDKNVNTARPKAVVNTAKPKVVLNAVKGNQVNAVKASACWIQVSDGLGPQKRLIFLPHVQGNPQMDLQDQGVIDSGCSKNMTGNMSYLTNFEEINGGYVAFGGNPKGGKITGRGTIKSGNLDFENVYFVRELQFNLFSVSQMCDKKNSVLFNDTECIVLSPNFKLTDESHVLLKVPRKNNMYSVDLNNIVPKGSLTFLFAKATSDESKLWHGRLGHINFKTMNKLVKGNLVRGLPLKLFKNDQTCVACQKGKQHRASCKSKTVSSISQPLHMLHMDLFGPKFIKSLMKKMYCLVVTDDYSRFSRVFFLATKDETSGILKSFITGVENLIDQRVKKSNGNAGTKACDDTGKARMKIVLGKDYILLPLWPTDLPFSQNSKSSPDAGFKPLGDNEKKVTEEPRKEGGDLSNDQEKEDDNVNNTNNVNITSDGNITNNVNVVSSIVNAAGIEVNNVGAKTSIELLDDPNMPELEDIVYSDNVGVEADMKNLNTFMHVSPIPTTRIHKDHPVEQIIKDSNSAPQTRRMTKNLKEHGLFSSVQQRTNHKDFQNSLFACFLSQEEPRKLQEFWTLVDLPNRKRAIGTKWVFRNKKDERGIVIKNKEILVAQGYAQEEGIDYDEVFAPISRIEAIRLFLAYASYKDFMVYQMDVKSSFLYEKELYGLHQALRAWYETFSTYLLDNRFKRGKIDKTLFIRRDKGDILLVQVYVDDIIFGSTKKSLCIEFKKMMHKKFQMSSMGELAFFLGLQVKQKEDGIFISQDKYVTEILKKFGFIDVKIASTPMETQKPLLKNENGEEVDVHLYRLMIGLLTYLTYSRPDIMYAVCACARYQVTLKVSNLHATDSDYARESLDMKSTIGGYQFLMCRLISWQCKKQIVVVNSTTEAEYVAASSCYGQVHWIQNQLLDYGSFNVCSKHKLTLLGKVMPANVNILLLGKINAARLPGKVNSARHKLTAAVEIVFLAKPAESEGFEQIVDFLNASSIRYALTVNPTIYTSCIEQFWSTLKVKTDNGEQQLQALVNGKKIVVTEASVRRDLQLDDEEGTDCLPNAIIFEELTRMGMVKNLDNAGKLLMYPRFIQVFLDNQLDGMSSHKRIYVTPSHTKKIFANMRRQGKDFSGKETPLFPTMVVQAQEEMGEGSANVTNPHHTPIIAQPSSSQPQKKHKSRRPKEKDTQVPQSSVSSDPTNVADEDSMSLKELMDFCTKLQQRVLDLEKTKTDQAKEITSLKNRVKKLEKKGGSRNYKLKRLYKGRKIDDIDADIDITLVNDAVNDQDMFDVNDLSGEEVFIAEQGVPDSKKDDVVQVKTIVTTVSTSSTIPVSTATITKDEISLAQVLAELKSVKPKVTTVTTTTTKGILLQELSESITTTTIIPLKDKGKAKFNEEVRLAREKDKANVALIEEWNAIQANIDVDYQLAQRLQAQKQKELTIEE